MFRVLRSVRTARMEGVEIKTFNEVCEQMLASGDVNPEQLYDAVCKQVSIAKKTRQLLRS